MRKSGVISRGVHILTATAALLWLWWYFIPVTVWVRGAGSLVIVVVACWTGWRCCRPPSGRTCVIDLPPPDVQGPIVLVCGDGGTALFPERPIRKTAQGCWLHVGDISALADVIRSVRSQQPWQTGLLSILYVCLPDNHQDEGVLRASVKFLRQQRGPLRRLTGYEIPVVVGGQFSGPETPWIIVRHPPAVICPAEKSVCSLEQWQQEVNNLTTLPVLGQAFDFLRDVIIDELTNADRLCPPLYPFAVVLQIGAAGGDNHSLWSHRLWQRTRLQFAPATACSRWPAPFADALLPMLAPLAQPLQDGQGWRRVIAILLFCALAAIAFTVTNNRDLIRRVGVNLARWQAIPMDHYEPKAQSLTSLKKDALLLERWQRHGEPLNYALGLYPGQRLWLALQRSIDTYRPPPPALVPENEPRTVRLDSLSLFDSGQSTLKPDSLKMLVSALVDIKARPGWLIVVSGHTDNTGNLQRNQALSLRRAEALRDWMVQTSDVSPACFAVQGYGATSPVADNNTPLGRALNRRVEISLIPQADACLNPDGGR